MMRPLWCVRPAGWCRLDYAVANIDRLAQIPPRQTRHHPGGRTHHCVRSFHYKSLIIIAYASIINSIFWFNLFEKVAR
jgi:hypothetical protein